MQRAAAKPRSTKERAVAKRRVAKGPDDVPRFVAPRARDVQQFFASRAPVRASAAPIEALSMLMSYACYELSIGL